MRISKSLAGSALIYTFTNGLSAGIPFLMLPVLTRLLTPEEYGIVAMFSVVVVIFGSLTGLNVHGAVGMRYFDRDQIDFARYVTCCLAILVVSTLIVFISVLGLLPWLVKFTKLPGIWLLIAVLVSCSQFVILTQLAIFQSSKQPWKFGALRLGQSGLDAAASLIFVLGLGMTWQGRIGGIAFAIVLIAGISLLLLSRGRWIKLPLNKGYVHNALNFGVPLIPHTIGGMLIAMVDRFMISNMLDVASTGVYMVGLQIGMALGLLTDSFNKAYAPWLIESLKKEDKSLDRKIVRFTYLYFLAVVGMALLIGLFAPAILDIFVGEQFRDAAPIVVYLAIGYAFGGMYYMVTNYVFFAGRTAHLAGITLICGLANVAISYKLLSMNGLVGAAQAFMIAQAILFFGTWWLANCSRPMPWSLRLLRVSAS